MYEERIKKVHNLLSCRRKYDIAREFVQCAFLVSHLDSKERKKNSVLFAIVGLHIDWLQPIFLRL